MEDDVAVTMVTVTCSTKYVNGVSLPVFGYGDSIQAKANNQTNQNLTRLQQSLQPNKWLLACANLAISLAWLNMNQTHP